MNSLDEVMNLMNENIDSINKFHIKKIGVFGSFARGEQTIDSDVDILVEFKENQETFDNYMDLKFYLEDLFKCEICKGSLILKSIRQLTPQRSH